MTLLQIVQRVLTYIDDTNVTSIDETEESEQIVHIANQVYDDIITQFPWPHLKETGTLETTSTAHIMKLPTDVLGVNWVRYAEKQLSYMTPMQMVDLLEGRDVSQSNVDANGALNDTNPRYWTTEDDFNIIFDAYSTALTAADSKCYFTKTGSWTSDTGTYAEGSEDTAVPDLSERFLPTYVYGCIAEANRVLKGDTVQGAVYDKRYKDGMHKLHRWARRINKENTTMPGDYGRKRGRGQRMVTVVESDDS